MDQVDLAATLQWDLIKLASKHSKVTYASVGSNHCQWRVSKQVVGKPVDDWGIFIVKQLRKLATEVGLDVKFLIPADYDESLAFDPFSDQFHVVGLFHGHQAGRPDSVPNWLDKQVAGLQPLKNYTIAVSGHFHHTRPSAQWRLSLVGSSKHLRQRLRLVQAYLWPRLNNWHNRF
jgi:hypothetical protein